MDMTGETLVVITSGVGVETAAKEIDERSGLDLPHMSVLSALGRGGR